MLLAILFGCTCVANALQMGTRDLNDPVPTEKDFPAAWGKVLFLLANKDSYLSQGNVGNSLLDVMLGYAKFRKRGYSVDFASLSGGDAPLDLGVYEDYKTSEYANSCSSFLSDHAADGTHIANTLKLEDTDHLEYNAIYIPGGLPAISEFSTSETVKNVMHEMFEGCRLVVTASTGGMSLLNVTLSTGANLVKGLSVSAPSNSDLKESGVYGSVKTNPCTPEDCLSGNGATFQSGFSVAHNLATAQNYTAMDAMFDAIDKAGGSFPNNCANMGSASGESVVVNFTTSKITQNNLNDGGPDTGIATLGFKNVATTADGAMVNMRITSDDYSSSHSDENGLWGNITLFGNVNVEQDKTVSLKYGFWTAPPNSQPVVINSFYLTFYDLSTHSGDNSGTYSVSSSDHEAYFLDHKTSVSTTGSSDEIVIATGTEEGSSPSLSSELSSAEKEQAITFLFANKSEVNFNISVWGGSANRNVRFTGRTIFRHNR